MATLPEIDPEDRLELLPARNDRSRSRRIALQILYEVDTTDHPAGSVMAIYLNTLQPSPKIGAYIADLVNGVNTHHAAIDAVIQKFASDFPIEQLAAVDRTIFRMALWELGIGQTVPIGVAVDEGVELAKLFGADESVGFINGVLSNIANNGSALAHLNAQAPAQDDDADADEDADEDESNA